MLEEDYLMRMLLALFKAMNRAAERANGKTDPNPREAANMLEEAIGNAVEMDGAVLLSLAPESIAQVMQVSGVDPALTQFVARSLLLESVYLEQAHEKQLAALRAEQARAIAQAYGFSLPEDPSDFEKVTEGLEEAATAGGFYDEPGFEPGLYVERVGADESLDALLGEYSARLDDGFAEIDEAFFDSAEMDYPFCEDVLAEDEDEQRGGFGSFIDRE